MLSWVFSLKDPQPCLEVLWHLCDSCPNTCTPLTTCMLLWALQGAYTEIRLNVQEMY